MREAVAREKIVICLHGMLPNFQISTSTSQRALGNTRDCGRMFRVLLRHELLATAENHRVRHPHERLAVAANLQSARR
jgi:hypothetical protein